MQLPIMHELKCDKANSHNAPIKYSFDPYVYTWLMEYGIIIILIMQVLKIHYKDHFKVYLTKLIPFDNFETSKLEL